MDDLEEVDALSFHVVQPVTRVVQPVMLYRVLNIYHSNTRLTVCVDVIITEYSPRNNIMVKDRIVKVLA